jgi:cation transport ATPase
MADLVAIAETSRNRYTSLADRAAKIYAPMVHILALAAFVRLVSGRRATCGWRSTSRWRR